MRIISGSNRGKKLIMPNDKTTRPLKDMAKESIFNILTHAKYINFHIQSDISIYTNAHRYYIYICMYIYIFLHKHIT